MKKYYHWSIIVNFIPIITTYIILHNCSSDGCMGKFLIWLTIPIWATIYLSYFLLTEKDNNKYFNRLIIYFPSLITSFLIIFKTVANDTEILDFFYSFLILILPTFLYNVFVDYKFSKGGKCIANNKFLLIVHPVVLLIVILLLFSIIYKPSFYKKDVFPIGEVKVMTSVNKIQLYLSDSLKNKYLLPDSIKVLPYPDYKGLIDKDDYFLFFNDNPTELIHIKISDREAEPVVEIKGIKTLKEEFKWQWRIRVKKDDEEAVRVLNRIDKTLKEIDPTVKTKICKP